MAQFKALIASTDILRGQAEDKLMRFTRSEVNFAHLNPIHKDNLLRYAKVIAGPLCYRLAHDTPENSNYFQYGQTENRFIGSPRYMWGPIKFIQEPQNGFTQPTIEDMLADPLNISFGSHKQKCRIESKSILDFIDDGISINMQVDPSAEGVDLLVEGLTGIDESGDYIATKAAAIEQAIRLNTFKQIDSPEVTNNDITAILSPRDWLDFLFGNKNPNSENYERFPSGVFEGKLILPEDFSSSTVAAEAINAVAGTDTFLDTVFDIHALTLDSQEDVTSCDYNPFTANNTENSNFVYQQNYNYFVRDYEKAIKFNSNQYSVTQTDGQVYIDEKILPSAVIFQLVKRENATI